MKILTKGSYKTVKRNLLTRILKLINENVKKAITEEKKTKTITIERAKITMNVRSFENPQENIPLRSILSAFNSPTYNDLKKKL